MKNKNWFDIKNAKITYTEYDLNDFVLVVEIENRNFSLRTNFYVDFSPEIEINLYQDSIWLFSFFEEMPSEKFADLPTETIQNIFEKWIIESGSLDYFEQLPYIQQEEYFAPYKQNGKEEVKLYEKLQFEKRLQQNHLKQTHLPQIYDALCKTNLLDIFDYCTSHAGFVLEILGNQNYPSKTYYRFYYDWIKEKYIATREEENLFYSFTTLSELIIFLEENYLDFFTLINTSKH